MYDVIVIGNDICSLIAATRAAQIGYKTALLSDKSLTDKFELSGYTFDLDPLPWPVINHLNDTLFSNFKLNLPQEASETNMQVILPGHRFDLVSGKYAQVKEIDRELPKVNAGIENLFDLMDEIHGIYDCFISMLCDRKGIQDIIRLIPNLLLKRILWALQIRKINDSAALKQFLNVQISALSNHFVSGGMPNADSAYLLSKVWKGDSFYSGDKGHIREEIRKSFLDYGGNVINGDCIETLLLDKEIDIVIREVGGEIMVSCRNVIISTKILDLLKIEHNSNITKWLLRRDEKWGPFFYPFTIHLGISANCIPEMMKDFVMLVPEDNFSFDGFKMILLNFAACGDLNRSPLNKRALSVTVFLQDSPLCTEDDKLIHAGKTVLNEIEVLLPFLRSNIDLLDLEMSIKLSRKSLGVASLRMSSSPGLLRNLIFRENRPKKNVILTGGEFYSEFGFTGEILSGIHAANQISGGKPNVS